MYLALHLFRVVDADKVSSSDGRAGSRALRLSLTFADSGLLPSTLGYARVLGLCDVLAKGGVGAVEARVAAESAAKAPRTSKRSLVGPVHAQPLGSAIEIAALRVVLGVVTSELVQGVTRSRSGAERSAASAGDVREGVHTDGHGSSSSSRSHKESDVTPNDRYRTARAWSARRVRVLESTRRVAEDALSTVVAEAQQPAFDLYA